MPSEWRQGVQARWTCLMQNWFSLMNLWIHQGRSQARLSAHPASTKAREKALSFAKALGYVTATAQGTRSTSALPAPKLDYRALDIKRQRCDHQDSEGKWTTKQYRAAGSSWMTCSQCGRRWKQDGPNWQGADKDVPQTKSSSSLAAKPAPSQPCSSRSAVSSSAPAQRASTTSRRRLVLTSRLAEQIPMSDEATSSNGEVSPWEHPAAGRATETSEEDL